MRYLALPLFALVPVCGAGRPPVVDPQPIVVMVHSDRQTGPNNKADHPPTTPPVVMHHSDRQTGPNPKPAP